MPYAQAHPGARTALQLAILSTFLCAFIAPFAWYKGLQARAAIRQNPTLYTGESEATAAIWIAGVYTIVAAIAVVVVTIYFALGVASGLR
jgi:archaellum biogenesis protein FlaJ (TadC family)